MRLTDKATADSRSVQSFAIIKNTGHGNFVIDRFTLELETDHPSETSLCTVAPSPTDTPLPFFFVFLFFVFFFSEGRGWLYTGYLERIILSSKVRRIVYSNLKLFHFQIKTYYLSDANHQTDNPSHTNNPSLV